MSGRIAKQRDRPPNNAARERSRVQSLRAAFLDLQRSLPSVPADTKLSKLDILVLATAYIFHLTRTLNEQSETNDKVNVSTRSLTGPAFTHFSRSLKSATGEIDESDRTTSSIGSPSRRKDSILKIQGHHVPSTVSGEENQNHPRETLLRVKSDSIHKSTDQFLSQFLGTRQCHGHSAGDQNIHKTNPQKGHPNCKPSGSSSRPRLLTGKGGAVGIMHPVKKWPMRCRLYQQILGCRPPS